MILTFIFIIMLLLGIIFDKMDDRYDILCIVSIFLRCFGTICLITSLLIIIFTHATASNEIEQKKINYDGLCMRYKVVKSEYEDVSKSDLIADITAWNTEVYNIKYWTENPWTSWFNPREVADNLYYIPLE